ncbi:hypothetical protein [Flavobacterium weaverense]|uniref:hypothetical protein n=1 Tax=Flavobacterium weaverense TaxID=271156 RepID=UPI001B88536D|nr:hypothetical protein [Flavobacterium weaverense]
MQNYLQTVKLFVKRFLVVLFVYEICRFLFYFFNRNAFESISFKGFLGGIHFDLSAIAYINLIFAVLHLLPGNFKYRLNYQKGLKNAFFTVNLIFILTNFVDFEYYKFTGRRSTFGMITETGMENEIGGLLFSFLVEFWYLPLLAIVLAFLFWKAIPNLKMVTETSCSKLQSLKLSGLLFGQYLPLYLKRFLLGF